MLTINAVEDGTTVSVGDFTEESEDDLRPQVVGVFTEIEDTPQNLAQLSDAGLNVHVEINSRFTSSPSTDRKSTRLNSSHVANSYAVFCLKKKIHAYISSRSAASTSR